MASVTEVVAEIKRQYALNIRQYTLKDVREVEDRNEDRKSACISLELEGTRCVGVVQNSMPFDSDTEPSRLRRMLTNFFDELKLMSELKHRNIVQFLGIYFKQDSKQDVSIDRVIYNSSLPVVVMERMECSLAEYLKIHERGSLPEDKVLSVLLDVSRGLVYLHEDRNVAHLNLCSTNILLSADLSAKIAYPGSVDVLERPGGWESLAKLISQAGSAEDFMPPEVLDNPPEYTSCVDVFSFGCVMIHVYTHEWPGPFEKIVDGKSMSEVERRQVYISQMDDFYLLPIVRQCLEELSRNRPSARDMMCLLEAAMGKGKESSEGTTPAAISLQQQPDSERDGSAQNEMTSLSDVCRKFQCEQSNKTFSRSNDRMRHMLVHAEGRPHQCRQCDRTFPKKSSLDVHLRIHTGEKPYQCQYCSKSFNRTSNLQAHLRTHTGEKPHQCQYCSRSFSRNSNLQVHLRTHTGEKPYQCQHCNKAFLSSSYLQAHMWSHTGGRPYECQYCKSTFGHRSVLTSHIMRVHTGEKPYQCEYCSRAFIKKTDLKRHVRIHTGEKPYQCQYCSRAFTQSSNLQVHLRTHTGETPVSVSILQ